MACGTETNCGTRSDARDNRGRGDCCCLYCQEVIGDCVTGCACLAKRLCVRFFPDDSSLATGYATYVYDANGQYIGSPANFGLGVEIVHDEYGERQWHFTSGSVTPALDEYVPVSEVGCNGSLTADGVILSVGALTSLGVVGTLVAAVYERQVIPLVTGEDGCTETLCTGCTCIPHCLCVYYAIDIKNDEGIENPEDPGFLKGTVHQRFITCYDPDIGGWYYDFVEFSCAPEKEVVIKIVPDDTGACALRLNATSYDSEHTDLEPTESLDCEEFGATWHFDSIGGAYGTTIQVSDADCADCLLFCCQDYPDTLTATLENIETCIDPEDLGLPSGTRTVVVSLNRINECTTPVWYGEYTTPKCDDPGIISTSGIWVSCGLCFDLMGTCVCKASASHCHTMKFYGLYGGFTPYPGPGQNFSGTWVETICNPFYIEATFPDTHGNTVTLTITE